ncbi:MAG: GNAT family N-acetyltransferase [Pseudonocardiales bacterium]|jgi:GNAT superfamily N-acetyltransferase|nr:GNAT family N-acetyltransferase [Pseudonocardiales bacterium]
MAFDVRPVTPDRVDDFVAVANPNRRATHCWCLSHRLGAREIAELGGGSREAAFRALCARPDPPGVIGYADGEPVGWCSIGPRSENSRLVASRLIRPLDDVPVWSVICVVVRGGHRKRGYTTPLIEGAVAHAAARGAPAVESYPVDPGPDRIDLTMAFVGTRAMFEKAGFTVAGTTDAVASGRPRLVMRRTLGP